MERTLSFTFEHGGVSGAKSVRITFRKSVGFAALREVEILGH